MDDFNRSNYYSYKLEEQIILNTEQENGLQHKTLSQCDRSTLRYKKDDLEDELFDLDILYRDHPEFIQIRKNYILKTINTIDQLLSVKN
jgi:hypothetical protein